MVVVLLPFQGDGVVRREQCIGQIVEPLTGGVLCEIVSPCDGLLFTIRAYPIVYEGSLLGRIFKFSS